MAVQKEAKLFLTLEIRQFITEFMLDFKAFLRFQLVREGRKERKNIQSSRKSKGTEEGSM